MSARSSLRCFILAVCINAGVAGHGIAQVVLEQRVYEVGDLITPLDHPSFPDASNVPVGLQQSDPPVTPNQVNGPSLAKTPFQAELMQLIKNTIAPESWSSKGGSGTLEYFPLGMSLVVSQTPEVHERIEKLLTALRSAQGIEVQVEVRLVSFSERFFERLCVDFGILGLGERPWPSRTPLYLPEGEGFLPLLDSLVYLNDQQVQEFLELIQVDRLSEVLQAPKLLVGNGESAGLELLTTQHFVTGFEIKEANGRPVATPRNEPATLGFQLAVRPLVAPDRRNVHLSLKAQQTELASLLTPQYPVTTYVNEGGQQVPFMQLIQQPEFRKLTVDRTLTIPEGSTVLLGGWKRVRESLTESEHPVLGKIPYVNHLFKTTRFSRCQEAVVLMVSARVVSGGRTKGTAVRNADTLKAQLADLMEKYHRACAEGRLVEASDLAGKARRARSRVFRGQGGSRAAVNLPTRIPLSCRAQYRTPGTVNPPSHGSSFLL